MKRTLTLALLIWLSLGHLPTATAQQHVQDRMQDEDDAAPTPRNRRPVVPDDDGDAVLVVKKKKPVHHKVLVGIEAGVGDSWLASPSVTNLPVLGWRVGGFVYLPIVGKLYLQPGLYYVTCGGAQAEIGSVETNTTTYALHQIEMPVNIGFRYKYRRSRYKTFVGIGPYIARNLGGTVASTGNSSEPLNIGTTIGSDIKPFDFGLGLNTSSEWHCGIFLRARVQYSLSNLSPAVNSTMTSFGGGIQVGYLFGKKTKIVKKRFKRMTRGNDNYNDPRVRPGDTDE